MHLLFFLGTFGEGSNNSNSSNRYKQAYSVHSKTQDTCLKGIIDKKL